MEKKKYFPSIMTYIVSKKVIHCSVNKKKKTVWVGMFFHIITSFIINCLAVQFESTKNDALAQKASGMQHLRINISNLLMYKTIHLALYDYMDTLCHLLKKHTV